MLAAKAELQAEQDKIVKLQAFDSSYFRGKSHFENDGTQNCLFIGIFKRMIMTIIFQCVYQMEHLIKVLNLLLHRTIVLFQ